MTNADEREPVLGPSAEDLTLVAVPLVHRIVHEIAGRVPACVDRDRLLSAGLVAALEAARSYDAAADGDFLRYANALVRSELLVVLRSMDLSGAAPEPAPVDSDTRLAGVRAALEALEGRHRMVLEGYFVHDRETAAIAVELGVAEAQVVQLRAQALRLLRDTLRGEVAGACAMEPQARAAYAAVAGRRLVQASSLPDGDGQPRGAA